ncbi:MAG: metal ABC transporter ATP-binding protein [Gemmataceae bacterium]|nr:metal ABC transporter ATP-binding protein [Gemmataceae bacterium]
MEPLVRLDNVAVEFRGLPVLRGVTTAIASGCITALIGLNGSGKTTLLRTILGEVPHAGRISFRGGARPVTGYVPQRLVIDSRMPLTVRDVFALALQRRPIFLGVSPAALAKTRELLARVFRREVEAILDRPVDKLSGGELQRVLLALALEPAPQLLLLDEPAAGIDFHDQDHFYDLICRFNRELGIAVVLVSHDTHMVTRHADRVLCLKDGRIQCEGHPGEVLSEKGLAAVFGDKAAFHHHH